jgi:hypothetical protein
MRPIKREMLAEIRFLEELHAAGLVEDDAGRLNRDERIALGAQLVALENEIDALCLAVDEMSDMGPAIPRPLRWVSGPIGERMFGADGLRGRPL